MSATKEFNHNEIENGQRAAIADIRDYPILFDTEMVQAILQGRKTQTIRICKHQHFSHSELVDININKIVRKVDKNVSCKYGQPGDLLWVKETMILNKNSNSYWPVADGYIKSSDYEKKIPSIHMYKKDARLWLQITQIKLHRLQSITEDEAMQEGTGIASVLNFEPENYLSFRAGFYKKWVSIYGVESWHENPWVWAIKFEICIGAQPKSL